MSLNRLSRHQRLVGSVILCISVIAIAALCLHNAYDYLSISRPGEPGILVVEGWLHRDGLLEAKEEFIRRKYRKIITTGFPNTDGFMMGSNGRLIFAIKDIIVRSADNTYSITLTIRGTKANKEYPHFSLFADSTIIGDDYTARRKKTFTWTVTLDSPPDSIMMEFDNDLYTRYRDRDITVFSISVNNRVFNTDNGSVVCYFRRNGRYYLYQRLSPNSARDAAEYLKVLGIPDSLIIPVVTTRKPKSRTYATALEVKQWMDLHPTGTRHELTVFSQGPHARRSYILYKKAFGTSADIGILSGNIREYNSANWWKSIRGWKSVLYETAGIIYFSIML
jgi:hypothetical protein